jgi:hypothetical protein
MVWYDFLEDEEIQTLIEKLVCPHCASPNTAIIFWGLPGNIEEIEKEIRKKKVVLGGCIVSENDPKWECTDCQFRWGKRDND